MIKRQTLSEQTAAHLAGELASGRWQGALPGVNRLAGELGISRETLRAALGLLEQQGLLLPQGGGRARVITPDGTRDPASKSLRVVVLPHDRLDADSCNIQSLLHQLKYRLEQAGHHCDFSVKCQAELGLDLGRISRLVERTKADAWVVMGGSLDLLRWFTTYPVPAIAVGGRTRGLPIPSASRNALPAFREVFRELIRLGHRRIVMIATRERRRPSLSAIERALQEEMTAAGIPFGDYNTPDWEPTPAGLEALLEALFRVTPPTVLQVNTPSTALGVLSFLNHRRLRVPEDVSLICETMDNTLAWHRPAIAHFTADYSFIVRRVVRWAKAVTDGTPDLRQAARGAEFDPGGSIAPPTGQ